MGLSPVRARVAMAGCFALLVLVATRPAAAEEPVARIAPVVVTASRGEQPLAETLPHTTVITSREIRESQATDLPALLRREAGVEIVQSGGAGALSTVFTRGAESRHTLLLIDGVRVDSATTGFAALDQILLDEVDRVEIVRGGVSSLYGSGALGGVIQVFTRRGRGRPRVDASVEVGSRDTARASASFGGEVDEHRFSATLSGFTTRGFSAIDPATAPSANPDDDGYDNHSAAASWSWQPGERYEVGLSGYRTVGNVFYDSAFAASPNDTHDADTLVSAWSAWVDAKPVDRWRAAVTFGEGRDDSENYLNGSPDGSFCTATRQLTWQNDFELRAGQRLTAGYERVEQRLTSSTAYTGTRRDLDSVWLAYAGAAGPHRWQASARHDHFSDVGNANTWLAGYGFDLSPAWKLTAVVSTGFAAPTFNFLYFPEFGNPDLAPERSRGGEFGIRFADEDVLARLVAFRTDYTDLIEGVPPTFVPQNVKSARVEGVEASLSALWIGVDWRAAFTLQNPVNRLTDEQLLRRARRFGSASATTLVGAWALTAEVLASGPRPDLSITDFGRIELPGYAVVNLRARYELDASWYLAIRFDNLFDHDYQVASGYNTAPFGVFATLGWRSR